MSNAMQKNNKETLYTLQMINSKNLKVLGEDYQRELNEGRVAKIVSSFNELVNGTLLAFMQMKALQVQLFQNENDLRI